MKRSLLLIIAAIGVPAPVVAQTVVGHLVDSSSARSLPRVDVRVWTTDERFAVGDGQTDSRGIFRIPATRDGPYVLKFSLPDGSKVSKAAQPAVADSAPEYRVAFTEAERQHMYFEFEVDRRVVVAKGVRPDRPVSFDGKGEVLIQVAVDSTGRADLATFRALRSPHPALTGAVERALGEFRFQPALKDGRPVRQLVQIPFIFN
jgi:hypothetical protein